LRLCAALDRLRKPFGSQVFSSARVALPLARAFEFGARVVIMTRSTQSMNARYAIADQEEPKW
jgi:hypothetical protein